MNAGCSLPVQVYDTSFPLLIRGVLRQWDHRHLVFQLCSTLVSSTLEFLLLSSWCMLWLFSDIGYGRSIETSGSNWEQCHFVSSFSVCLSPLYFEHMGEDVFLLSPSLFVIRETEREWKRFFSSVNHSTSSIELLFSLPVGSYIRDKLVASSFAELWRWGSFIDLHSCSLISSATCRSTVDI